ncbi:hypothetical protein KOR42_05580 [Thalassoglobus neptunius]|uniref:Carboxypeptidase regulatory-like domain-containing protein n=1 Tax=Thalassoglobus neptunius TaxID=1938619 RepID=A0A5C5X2W6_9PLAN|nr:hypothetical protein [Thalassoglobus neptunius]TWT57200.1 hypothetical protein KOR42_05580 [Thalassoglobus neptunius]
MQEAQRQRGLWQWCLVGCLFAVGCGGQSDRPEMATVSGKLTLDGKPLPGYIVTFQPSTGRPSVSNMPTNAEGQFELWYTYKDKGAKVDKHKVTLAYSPTSDDEAMAAQSGNVTGNPKAIAEKYGTVAVTPLEFEVSDNTTEANIDISLN